MKGKVVTKNHTPTPWIAEITNEHPTGRILKGDIVVAYGTSRTDTLFIVKACNAETALRNAAALALCALNNAARFRVNATDSYAIASLLEEALGLPKNPLHPLPHTKGPKS